VLTTLQEVEEFVMTEVKRLFPSVVHVLKGGYPMCGFSLALPEQWAPGNTWVSFLDKDLSTHANCPDCLEAHSAYKPS
jgi:hypothetical protein